MKQQSSSLTRLIEKAPLKTEVLYDKEQHLAAIHLFTPNGLFSYNGPANEFPIAHADRRNWDIGWFSNYE